MGELQDAIVQTVALVFVAITSFQVATLTWVPSLGWGDAYDTLEDLSKIRIAVDGQSYEVWFQAAVFTVLGYAIYGIFTMMMGEMCCEGIDEIIWGYIGVELLYGVGFVPLFSILIDVFNCVDGFVYRDHSIECGTGKHTTYVLLSVAALVVMLVGFIYSSLMRERLRNSPYKPNDPISICGYKFGAVKDGRRVKNIMAYRQNMYVEPRFTMFRAIACVLALMLTTDSEGLTKTSAVFLVFLGLVPPLYLVYYLPYFDNRVNVFKVGLYMGTWTSFLASMAVALDDESDDNDAGIGLLSCYPVLVVLGMLVCFIRIKAHDPYKDLHNLDKAAKLNWNNASTAHMKAFVKKVPGQPDILEINIAKPDGLMDLYTATATDKNSFPSMSHFSITASNEYSYSPAQSPTVVDVESGGHRSGGGACKCCFSGGPTMPVAEPATEIPLEVADLQGVPLLIAALDAKTSRFANAQEATVSGFNLKNKDEAVALANAMFRKPLVKLDLWNNRMGDACCTAVAQIMHDHPSLTSLNFGSNGLSHEAKENLTNMFKDKPQVELVVY